MKTSNKIILSVGGLVLASFITSLYIFRTDLQKVLVRFDAKSNFKTVPFNNFENLDFSSKWIVNIKQGSEFKVELASDQKTLLKPKLENIDGTLFFKIETPDGDSTSDSIRARITVPILKSIKAAAGTKIHLAKFVSDSLKIILENGCAFTGHNGDFKNQSFKTSGEVFLQLTKD